MSLSKENREKGEVQQEREQQIPQARVELRFGQRVHELRLQKRLSQDALATLASLHRNYISDVERGKRNVSIRVIELIANALGVEMKELFE